MAYYQYYNPNPNVKFSKDGNPKRWLTPDCVERAICKAIEVDWLDAFDMLVKDARENYDVPSSRECIDRVLNKLGFEKVKYPRGTKRERVKDFAKNHPNDIAILNLSGHVVCSYKGKYYDTFDSGSMTAYNYWLKK